MSKTIYMPNILTTTNGPASFQKKLIDGFIKNNIATVTDSDENKKIDAALIINATKKIIKLCRFKSKKIKVVQRLGSPYLSNIEGNNIFYKKVRANIGKKNMLFIRNKIANDIIYQSYFVKKQWENMYGELVTASEVIYNGIDTDIFKPTITKNKKLTIISVEGNQSDVEYSPAVLAAQEVYNRGYEVELNVIGNINCNYINNYNQINFINVLGKIENYQLPFYYNQATVYVLNDIVNAGCPNSVIEALACGIPVIGYKASVLEEMINENSGICVPMQGNPWRGQKPGNVKQLADAVISVYNNQSKFKKNARQLAKKKYTISRMIKAYDKVLFD